MLLHLRQNLHPVEEITEITDQALSILLDAACGAASGELPLSMIWNTLCTDQWLLSIRRDDIESTDLYERIVISFLGAALAGNAEGAAINLVNIGTVGLNSQFLPKILDKVLQAVITRQAIKIISTKELAVKHEQECNIQENIVFEGGKYRHIQNGGAPHFARFEAIRVFPALSELWDNISSDLQLKRYSSAHSRLDNINVIDWYNELNSEHDNPVISHPHFSKKIRDFMEEFVCIIKEHVAYCENIWVENRFILIEDELQAALQLWAGKQAERGTLVAFILKGLEQPICEIIHQSSLISALDLCKPIILRCPHFITWLREQQEPETALLVERLILEDLVIDFQLENATTVLEANSAWKQLAILGESVDGNVNRGFIAKHNQDLDRLKNRRNEVLATNNQSQIDNFDKCIQGCRFPAALQILDKCGQYNANIRMQEKVGLTSFVEEQIKNIIAVRDTVEVANMSEEWQDAISIRAAKIETQLRNLRRSEETRDVIESKQTQLRKAIEALSFVARKETQGFAEVDHHLNPSQTIENSRLITDNEKKIAHDNCPELHKNWNILVSADSSDEGEIKRVWIQFVKEFAKVCNLYHDEQDEKNRFKPVPSIIYPYSVYETAFYKPQSTFLQSPLRLYLYRQNVDSQALQRLQAVLSEEDSAAWLHIVFAPQGFEKISRFFSYDKGFKNFLIVDDLFLYKMSLAEKHDVPVRQALHASVKDLSSSSPFTAHGICHQRNNIYVGRKEILNELLNTRQAMIWGGRRIGKTSVLHALKNSLGRRNYKVAFVYGDLSDQGDPDLTIAQKIASELGLQNVSSLTDFVRQITQLRSSGFSLAFLIDEVDEYIKKSRNVYGKDFPLATALRQLVMEDSSGGTVLVYAGYHQLYFEARLDKEKQRVGHPFFNIAQDIPIRDLSQDEVNELVSTGFEEMLGIGVSPEVPRRISERASHHPAFVQQFCRCLLERVSKRRSSGKRVVITLDDVEAVYWADVSRDGGEQPFIFYVVDTLERNLSNLGRAIMLAIPMLSSKKQDQNEENYFSIRGVMGELNQWSDILNIANPKPEHFSQTLELLVMSNMLSQNNKDHDKYSVTYPTYIDILRRLDKLGQIAIDQCLLEYESKERNEGVIK